MSLSEIEKRVVGLRVGLIQGIWCLPATELDSIYIASTDNGDYRRYFTKYDVMFGGGGKGYTEEEAKLSAIGEFFERYSSAFYTHNDFVISSKVNLENSLELEKINIFSNEQYGQDNFPFKKTLETTELSWTEMVDVINEKSIFVPSVFVYFPFFESLHDTLVLPTSTNGLACHNSRDLSKLSAILEHIERDLLTNAWLSQSSFQKSEIPKDVRWNRFFEHFAGEAHCVFLENEFELDMCLLTLVFPAQNGMQIISSGSACAFSKREAFSKAFLEVIQSKKFIQSKESNEITQVKEFNEVDTFVKHCLFYSNKGKIFKKIPLYAFDLKEKEFQEGSSLELKTVEEKLCFLYDKFSQLGLDLFLKELTTIDAKQIGFYIYRAYSPQLSQFYGNENYKYLGQRRIFKKSIFKNAISSKNRFNIYPHFLG